MNKLLIQRISLQFMSVVDIFIKLKYKKLQILEQKNNEFHYTGPANF